MRLAAFLVFGALALGSSGGDAIGAVQMYKCIVGGRTVYQQQGCPVDAEPAASAAVPGKTAVGAGAPASSNVKRVRPASAKPSSASATPR